MGKIVRVECSKCGYTREFYLGVGFIQRKPRVLRVCVECKELVAITDHGCPECSNKTTMADEKTCPKCAAEELKVIPAGLWD